LATVSANYIIFYSSGGCRDVGPGLSCKSDCRQIKWVTTPFLFIIPSTVFAFDILLYKPFVLEEANSKTGNFVK
jgi:hypothetical protein